MKGGIGPRIPGLIGEAKKKIDKKRILPLDLELFFMTEKCIIIPNIIDPTTKISVFDSPMHNRRHPRFVQTTSFGKVLGCRTAFLTQTVLCGTVAPHLHPIYTLIY
jgi:hypothetical protein